MKFLSVLFFYGYVLMLIFAGAWGVFFAGTDLRLLFHLDPTTLPTRSAASLLSQYRFLRAIELWFGVFSLIFRRQIWEIPVFNRLFLGTMGLGVVARIVSRLLDGSPYVVFDFFLGYELIGVLVIASTSRTTLRSI